MFKKSREDIVHVSESLNLPISASEKIEKINELAKNLLEQNPSLFKDSNSPIWYRGLVKANDPAAEAETYALCRFFNVARIIVGHSARMDHMVKVYAGGRLIDADVAISGWMNRRSIKGLVRAPTALVMNLDSELTIRPIEYEEAADTLTQSCLLSDFKSKTCKPRFINRGTAVGSQNTINVA